MNRTDRALSRLAVCLVLAWAAVILPASPAGAQAPATGAAAKLDTILRDRARQLGGRSQVIVEFTSAPDVRVFARGATGRRLGARAQVGQVDNHQLHTLAADPRVARVMLDRPAFPTLDRTGLATGAVLAREELGLTGRGVGVAVIDSGITAYHDDLYLARSGRPSNRIVHFRDFTRRTGAPAGMPDDPYDDFGHGTHVAGIVAGSGYDSRGARTGIAPGAHLIGLKVLDGGGHGYISDVIAAIEYATAIRATYNIRVINLSVASAVIESYDRDPLTLAARRATEAGIVVVAAAGNLGRTDRGEVQYGGITSPANAPWVLTVGAASHQGTPRRSDDALAPFSSRGPTWIDFGAKPDLVAPGVGTESLSDPQSTMYSVFSEYLFPGAFPTPYQPYLSLTGTSMAAPVVSGTIALMLQANPALTPNAVKAILQYTAQARSGEDVLAHGAGLLNTRGAVRLATFFADPEPGMGEMADPIAGESIPWARHLIWGNYRVTGGVPLPGSSAWAPGVAWGDAVAPDGTPVVWGARSDQDVVWSTATNNIVWSTATSNIVWSTASYNIVWSTATQNIVWSTAINNIVWSTADVRNVVWGDDCEGGNCTGVLWGAPSDDGVWGTARGDENIVWNTATHNIVWSTATQNIVWSTATRNIVWSTAATQNIVWSTGKAD